MFEICICTHNPRANILKLVLLSIARQRRFNSEIKVLIIDNGSEIALEENCLQVLQDAGIPCRLVREDELGISAARYRAIQESASDWILFVDDDNELFLDYISIGETFIEKNPEVGCFGGKLMLPPSIEPPEWTKPFLPYLGIKDLGNELLKSVNRHATECEPPTAGAFVRRDVANLYLHRYDSQINAHSLGRKGSTGLYSSEDSLMMRGAYDLGLANAYCPELKLWHHLAVHRFDFSYLMRLMSGYGPSQILLERQIVGEHPLEFVYDDAAVYEKHLDYIVESLEESGRIKSARVAWHVAARRYYCDDLENNAPRKRFTVVTPCLNAASTIERTITSVLEQGYHNLQYIVCDGGSDDGTLEILEQYRSFIDQLIVGKDKNIADALNKGFAYANGEYRCYLNADDCFAPSALKKVAKIFDYNDDIDVITGACHRFFADGTTLVTYVPDRFSSAMALRNDIEQPSTFWRAEIQKRAGPFDDNYRLAFDWEYWNRLLKVGAKIHITKKLLSEYYFSDSNLTSNAGNKIIHEMYAVTRDYAGKDIADLYMSIFDEFDMRGYLDCEFGQAQELDWRQFKSRMDHYRRQFGDLVVDNYNWNWASKQIRGLKWY